MTFKLESGFLLSLGVLSLTACNSEQPADAASKSTPSGIAAPSEASSDPDAQYSPLIAAAEPFEALTEQAPVASPDKLKVLISDVQAAVSGVTGKLDDARQSALDRQLIDIAIASERDDRADIALASIEGYRTLIESARDTGPVPRAVSLLDYAGFRYQADLAARPVRWDDATKAMSFADSQWAGLERQVADAALKDDFAKALETMRIAAKASDLAAARSAVAHELDLVDKLEQHFNKKP
jgi:hypothetical protein